jgi:hypothetical protein
MELANPSAFTSQMLVECLEKCCFVWPHWAGPSSVKMAEERGLERLCMTFAVGGCLTEGCEVLDRGGNGLWRWRRWSVKVHMYYGHDVSPGICNIQQLGIVVSVQLIPNYYVFLVPIDLRVIDTWHQLCAYLVYLTNSQIKPLTKDGHPKQSQNICMLRLERLWSVTYLVWELGMAPEVWMVPSLFRWRVQVPGEHQLEYAPAKG